jgi:hypothetical protein
MTAFTNHPASPAFERLLSYQNPERMGTKICTFEHDAPEERRLPMGAASRIVLPRAA